MEILIVGSIAVLLFGTRFPPNGPVAERVGTGELEPLEENDQDEGPLDGDVKQL